jgi:uncharacterized repeat protein (TIGR01451 family)
MRGRKPFVSQGSGVAIGLALALLIGLVLAFPAVTRGKEEQSAVHPPVTITQDNHTLALAKSGSPNPVLAGGLLTYTLLYTVTGSELAPNVVITDAIPPHTTFQSCQPDCTGNGGVVTWTLGTIPTGTGQVSMTVLVDSPLLSGTLLINHASIYDGDGHRHPATATTTLIDAPTLTVTKTVTPEIVRPGDTVEYTILVEAHDTRLVTGVAIDDQLPAGFDPPARQWLNQTIDQAWTRTFTARVPVAISDGTYLNQVTVSWQGNSTATGPTAPVLVDGTPPASRAASPGRSLPGVLIDVTWIATETLSGVDTVVLWYSYGGVNNWKQAGLSGSGLSGTFEFEPLDGEGIYYFETVATDIAGNVEGQIAGTGDTTTLVAPYRVYLPITLKNATVDLGGSTKTAAQAFVEPGQVIDYTITLRNSGSLQADFFLYDPIPDQASFASATPPCTYNTLENRIEWSGLLDPQHTATCQYSLQSNPGTTGEVLNTAHVYDGFHAQPVGLAARVPIPAWYRGQDLPQGQAVYTIAACPTNCDLLYAGTRDQGIWKSETGGVTWAPVGLNGQMVRSVAIAPGSQCQVVYATTWGSGVWKSTNAGATWSATNAGLSDLYLYALVAGPDDLVYVGTSASGVYKSQDAGSTWTPSSEGLPSSALVYTLILDPADPQILYAGTWERGVFKTENGAISWSAMNDGLDAPMNIFGLAVQAVAPGAVYAATEQHGLYRWDTGTARWVNEWGFDRVAYSAAVDDAGTLYLGTDGQSGDGFWRRSLAGVWQPLWTQIDTHPAVRAITIAPPACAPARLLWLGTADGAWWLGTQ